MPEVGSEEVCHYVRAVITNEEGIVALLSLEHLFDRLPALAA